VNKAIGTAHGDSVLSGYAGRLSESLTTLDTVTAHLMDVAKKSGAEVFLADAVLYLEMFSLIAVAWQWTLQALAARKALDANVSSKDRDFYEGKIAAFRYFISYELTKTLSLAERLTAEDPVTVDCQASYFND
jgi:butyryl-CoA dehydrogenase